MEKYIIIALILLLGIVYYFDRQQQNGILKLQQTSTLEIDKNKPKQDSFFKTVVNHFTKLKKQKKSNNVFYQNHPDSDRSHCSQFPTVDEKITTNFVGYVLEYPCTAIGSGHISISKNEDGSLKQDYKLTLGMRLGSDKSPYWSLGRNEGLENTQSFLIFLKSNGETVKSSLLLDSLHQYSIAKIDGNVGLKIYLKKLYQRSVIALLINFKDALGNSPSIRCYIDPGETVDDLFSDLYNLKYKYSSCSAYWMLTNKISVTIFSFKAKYAYRFEEIYKAINQGLLNIIIEKPNETRTEKLIEKYIQSQLK